jgi:hypothetical protein
MKWTFNACERHRQNLALLAAGALANEEAGDVRYHLAGCADCRRYFEEIRAVSVQLAECEKNLEEIEPSAAAQNRWRRMVEAAGRPQPQSEMNPGTGFRGWWLEVVWPSRRIWAGLAAVWVLVLAGNLSLHDCSRAVVAHSTSSQMEMVTAFKDKERVLAELLGDRAAAHEAVRQNPLQPRPRTQRPAIFTA